MAYGKEFRQQKSHIRTYNFHPALNLSVTHPDTAKISRLRRSDLSQCTIVGVFGPRSSGLTSDRLLYGVDARPGKGFLVSKTKAFHGYHPDTIGYSANNIGNLLSGLSSPSAFREQALRVLSYHRSTAPTTGVWSAVGQEATLIQGVGSVTGASSIQTAFGSLLNPLGAFDGYTPEMIVYARKLTPFEQVQISSYLSIKYGITPTHSIYRGTNLLRDYETGNRYNHRLAGIMRERSWDLYQRVGTTSYEEADNYSDQYDSFFESNPYNETSEHRLLSIGREDGNTMDEGSYLLWSDNDRPLTMAPVAAFDGLLLMQRGRQTYSGGMAPPTIQKENLWQSQLYLTIASGSYYTSFSQKEMNQLSRAVTKIPLLEETGSFSFFRNQLQCEYVRIGFSVTDAAVSGSTCSYGYQVRRDGRIYIVVNNTVGNQVATAGANDKISICKNKTQLYLRIGSRVVASSFISIPVSDRSRKFFGIVQFKGINTGENNLTVLTQLRSGGFYDTGNKVELSYSIPPMQVPMSDMPHQVFLCRNMNDDFYTINKIEFIRASEVDPQRQKVIFHNLFWDAKTYFRFGYITRTAISIDTESPGCDGMRSQCNGSVDLLILSMTPEYEYVLSDSISPTEPRHEVCRGISSDTHLHIGNLAEGYYTLEIFCDGELSESLSFFLEAECRKAQQQAEAELQPAEEELMQSLSDRFLVYPLDASEKRFRAKYCTDESEAFSLLVFDATGRMILKREKYAVKPVHSEDFTLSHSGVYIVKLLTEREEHTQKIIVK